MILRKLFLFLLIPFLAACKSPSPGESEAPPNIIYILADDLGMGDLGYMGQEEIRTPNIDRLAAGGMIFTDHYSGSTVCAPSRSVLLTGQHTGHTPVRGNREIQPEGQKPLAGAAFTIPEMLKEQGYVSGAFGKWGLGFVGTEGDPNAQGFDTFFGYNCQRYAHRYYPPYLWHNSEKVYLEGNDWTHTVTYAPDVIHEKVLEFIRTSKDKPFFLYYASTIPHAEIIAPEDEILDSYMGRFEETPYLGGNTENPGAAAYGPDMAIPAYCPQEHPKAHFAAMVTRLDRQVGEVVALLEEEGLAENTLIFFASDNGPHYEGGAHPDNFNSNHIYRGGKRDLYEGGIRTPMLAYWPGTVEKGTKTAHISAFWDIMPTLAKLAGAPLPDGIDGISFVPTLLGEGEQEEHEYLYWEFHAMGGRQAVRQGKWKLVKLNSFSPEKSLLELYDLEEDPSETTDLSQEYPEVLDKLVRAMEEAHTPSRMFPFPGEVTEVH